MRYRIDRVQLPRRTFLQGLGTTMALPLLECMRPTSALAADLPEEPPQRAAFIFTPNGVIMPAWTPAGSGEDYQLSETLQPLEEVKQDLTVISGLAQDEGRPKGDGAGDHARSASVFLTGAHPVKTHGADIRVGISVDQVAAQQVGDATKLPSLELGIERGRTSGNCDSGYSCAYSSAVSWKSATTPMAKETNPRLVFERLFGSDSDADEHSKRRREYRKSILDLVVSDAERLKKKLGQTDRRKIDEYFTSVRELEHRIERIEQSQKTKRPDFEVPDGVPRDKQKHIRLMYDLMALAFRTDTTRIVSFMVGNAGSNRTYPMVDVNSGHHQLSHHRNDKQKVADLKKIDKFLIGEFGYFLKKLKAVPEGTRTLLDNSMILYGSGLSDGNRHRHNELPILLAGRAGGSIQPGRHLHFDRETPLNNLFLSLLDRLDAGVESIGDSTSRLKTLDA